jgi:hypothetical protein
VTSGGLEPGLAGDARHHPVARDVHLVRDLDADRVEGLPEIVLDQARRDECQRDQHQHRGSGRQRKAGEHGRILGPKNKKAA